MQIFNPRNWYWAVAGSTTQVYSSASNTYVPTTDATYAAWLAAGFKPSQIASEADIWFYVQSFMPSWLFDGTTIAQPTATTYSKTQLKAYAASVRYNKETGGTTVGGAPVATDRQSQAMLSGAYNMATQNSAFTTQWKNPDGSFTNLTAAQIISIATAVGQHVANCFSTEASVGSQVDAGTLTSLPQIDQAFASIT